MRCEYRHPAWVHTLQPTVDYIQQISSRDIDTPVCIWIGNWLFIDTIIILYSVLLKYNVIQSPCVLIAMYICTYVQSTNAYYKLIHIISMFSRLTEKTHKP